MKLYKKKSGNLVMKYLHITKKKSVFDTIDIEKLMRPGKI